MAAAKKANPEGVLITAATKASKLLTKGTSDFEKVLEEFRAIPDLVEDLGQQIIAKEMEIADANSELESIQQAIPQAQREARAELELQIKENKQTVTARLLEEAGLEASPQGTVTDLRAKLEMAKDATESAVTEAVRKATDETSKTWQTAMQAQEHEHTAATAELTAKVGMQEDQIAFLNKQLDKASQDRDADRRMAVEIAEAESKSAGVTVNNGK